MDKIFDKAFKAKSDFRKEIKIQDSQEKIGVSVQKKKISKLRITKSKKINVGTKFDQGKRQKTEDGYLLYKEDELNLGKGGETQDCPFDCNCCF